MSAREIDQFTVVDEDGNEYPVHARNIADQNVLPVESGAIWEAHAIYQVPADATGLLLLIYDASIKLESPLRGSRCGLRLTIGPTSGWPCLWMGMSAPATIVR